MSNAEITKAIERATTYGFEETQTRSEEFVLYTIIKKNNYDLVVVFEQFEYASKVVILAKLVVKGADGVYHWTRFASRHVKNGDNVLNVHLNGDTIKVEGFNRLFENSVYAHKYNDMNYRINSNKSEIMNNVGILKTLSKSESPPVYRLR